MESVDAIARLIEAGGWQVVALVGIYAFRRPLSGLVSKLISLKASPNGAEIEFAQEAEEARVNAANLPSPNVTALPAESDTSGLKKDETAEPPGIEQDARSDITEGSSTETRSSNRAHGLRITPEDLAEVAEDGRVRGSSVRQLAEHLARTATHRKLRELAVLSPEAAVVLAFKEVELAMRSLAERNGTHFRNPLETAIDLQKSGRLSPEYVKVFDQLRRLRNSAIHSTDGLVTPSAARDYVGAAMGFLEHVSAIPRYSEPLEVLEVEDRRAQPALRGRAR